MPHDRENKQEHNALGTSLMGAGNHSYRRERWNGGKGSFLTLASSMRLAAHPLFAGRTRGRELQPKAELADLRFAAEGRTLSITGTVSSDVPCYAVIAYVDGDEKPGGPKSAGLLVRRSQTTKHKDVAVVRSALGALT